jgi:hypothetical protein
MTAAHDLTQALLQLAEQGEPLPCQGRQRDRWTSEDRHEREWAASVCVTLACPVLDQCAAAGHEMKASYVWGGHDRTPKAKTTS